VARSLIQWRTLIAQAERFCTVQVSNDGFTTEGTERTEVDIMNGMS
jgi:hypothetical protein